MIPRYQIILVILLLVASAAMATVLWRLRQHAHQRILAGEVSTHTQAPQVAPSVQATLIVANDADGSLTPRVLSLPLPSSPNERARSLLSKLLDIYAAPGAAHPVSGGTGAVLQVFLLPLAASGDSQPASRQSTPEDDRQLPPELAVVDLSASFANDHPSGLETETLTILSICETLHANMPRIAQVRFLVNDKSRATLAGHADLIRTYLATEASSAPPVVTGAAQ